MNRTTTRALLLAIVPLSALALAACSGTGDSGMPMNHGTMASPTAAASTGGDHSAADTAFAQMMIAHHRQAVEMSTFAETRASDAEIKQLAAQIKAAQQPEIDTMTSWLNRWGQPTAQPGGHAMPGMGGMPGMMTDAELQQLRTATGTEFDRAYARLMIAHHNGAIQMAGDELKNGTDPDARALAQRVITSQSAEVTQLQKILDRL